MIHSLYTNKDIFLRELISNASDASDKLRYLSVISPELNKIALEFKIQISANEKDRTITIQDNGIGFHQDSIDLYARGNGLYNMNYRMKSIDGTCILFSNRRGCSVILEVELPNI